jgi:hypothetical protein
MAIATFRHGNPIMVDYTPAAGDVAPGDVVLVGEVATNNTAGYSAIACVAHTAIPNNVKGAVAAGGGVYECVNLNNAANGAVVFFDGTNKVTTVTNTKAKFGYIVGNGGGGANSSCYVLHDPKF